jgi:hypothetical protein
LMKRLLILKTQCASLFNKMIFMRMPRLPQPTVDFFTM